MKPNRLTDMISLISNVLHKAGARGCYAYGPVLFVFILCFCACQDRLGTGEETSPKIAFTTVGSSVYQKETFTKTTAVTTLTDFNVFCSTGTLGTDETQVFLEKFSEDSDNPGQFIGGQYWPSEDKGYNFYASNIAIANFSQHSTGRPLISVADNSTDVVCAILPSENATFEAVNSLSFGHIFSRIDNVKVIKPESGLYDVEDLCIKVDYYPGGQYDMYEAHNDPNVTGWTTGTPGITQATIASVVGVNENDLYVVPGELTFTATYTLTNEDLFYEESFTKTATLTLKKGYKHKITATLPEGNLKEIKFSIEVAPWDEVTNHRDF